MSRLSGPRHTLLVEMLEDRRVLSTLALGAVFEAPVETAAGTIAAATAQLDTAVTSKPERPEHGPPAQVIERLADNLPEHVVSKHPLLNGNHSGPTSPEPANPGNGNSGHGDSGGNGNSGNNPTNPGNGAPTRPETPPTSPGNGTPSGPIAGRPDRVDTPANPRPDDSDPGASVQDFKLTFTPEGGNDVAVRNDAAAAPPPAGAQQQRVAAPETAAELGASTRLVQETVEAGVRPTEDAAPAEDGATAELLEQIALLEAEAAAATAPGELQGADLAALTGGGIDLRALDEALRQAVVTAQRAGEAVAQTVAQPGFATWIVGSIGSLLALEGLRRVRRRRARRAGALADDPALTWVPGMPGSLSIEDA